MMVPPRVYADTCLPATSVLFESALFFLTMYAAISKMTAHEAVGDLLLKLIRDGILYFLAVTGKAPTFLTVEICTDRRNCVVCTMFGLMYVVQKTCSQIYP